MYDNEKYSVLTKEEEKFKDIPCMLYKKYKKIIYHQFKKWIAMSNPLFYIN